MDKCLHPLPVVFTSLTRQSSSPDFYLLTPFSKLFSKVPCTPPPPPPPFLSEGTRGWENWSSPGVSYNTPGIILIRSIILYHYCTIILILLLLLILLATRHSCHSCLLTCLLMVKNFLYSPDYETKKHVQETLYVRYAPSFPNYTRILNLQ